MGVNYATKYSSVIDEKFAKESVARALTNQDYDWNGVQSVVVYSYPSMKQLDYTSSGANRYGNPAEIENNKQTLTVGMDRAFSITIDRKNFNDTQFTAEVGKVVARQLREQTIPEEDQYTFATMLANVGNSSATAITNANAYSQLVEARRVMVNKKVPVGMLVCVATSTYYAKLLTDDHFIRKGDLSQEMLITGQVGTCAGMPVVEVPDMYLFGAEFMVVAPIATTMPFKIEDLKIHDNPPGINGWLIEGRFNYDAFVLTNKRDALYYNAGVIESSYAAGADETHTVVTYDIDAELAGKAGLELVYKADFANAGAVTTTIGTDLTAWTAIPATGILLTAANKYAQIALRDKTTKKAVTYSAGKVVAVGAAAAGGGS